MAFDEIFQIHQTDPDTNGNKRKSGGNVKHRNNDENTEYGKKNHISSDEERNTINGTVDEQGSNDLRNGDVSGSMFYQLPSVKIVHAAFSDRKLQSIVYMLEQRGYHLGKNKFLCFKIKE